MVFSSLLFLYFFLPACLVLYYLLPWRQWQNYVLIIASLIFYAWGEPVWVFLLIFSALVDYLNGLWIEKFRGRRLAKLAILSTLVINLGLLAAFKYLGFIVANLNYLLSFFDLQLMVPANQLPIGISFYTFQTISYTIDVYKGEVRAQRDFGKFLLFVSLFHQLVAGPIVRYAHIAREIVERVFSWEDFYQGVTRFVTGLAKKVIIANTAGEIADVFLAASGAGNSSWLGAWWGILLYTIQIYYDFSGYSDMAIGLGRMFGFHYHENFKYPYIATSAAEFWRRWHISLGSFFRDYLYIPLGGSRKRMAFNLFLVWFLTGLWHGASWNFVFWGLFYGLLIFIEKILLKITSYAMPRVFKHTYMFFVTLIGWSFFYFDDLSKLGFHFKTMFSLTSNSIASVEISIVNNLIFLAIALSGCLPIWPKLKEMMQTRQRWQQLSELMAPLYISILLIVATAFLAGKSYNPFIYFRF